MRSLLIALLFAMPVAASNSTGPAPGFQLPARGGKQITLGQFRGQGVMVNFWATWCGPCRTEIPWFSKFATENPDIVVLGIATDGEPDALRSAVQNLGISYPVLRTDSQTYKAYDISVIPTTVVVAADGSVQDVHVGAMSASQLERAIR